MQENTFKEVERLQQLTKIQVETIAVNIEMQTILNSLIAQQADEERKGLQEVMSINNMTFQDMALRRFESQKPERNHKYMQAYIRELNRISSRIAQIKENLKES